MIRDKKTNRCGPIVVDLTGPQGNAYFLLGMANDLGRQLKFDKETRDLVHQTNARVGLRKFNSSVR